ncbi:hypothetical protein FH972_024934 [Carpinus fangiana]|uniref:Cytochrome P450 n=1 Tax=Carpinus fangiana TaxID=176857 RepID=A0A5N6L047_9ROSI|nr:hypothetical protein FH972_024934 [Carpinus fangiana]
MSFSIVESYFNGTHGLSTADWAHTLEIPAHIYEGLKGYRYPTMLAIIFVAYFILRPLYHYGLDKGNLRRFPGLNCFAHISNLPFMIAAHKGHRSLDLVEMHKKYPVIRTGPNAVSFSSPKAIKDIYGHNTRALKDGQYRVTAGSHYHLADVIDRAEHARKRKVLSSAYALKNLEDWEFKVADKTARLIKQFDARCTAPLPADQSVPDKADLTIDYRAWTNFFTLDAIADIGLSEHLGFLDAGTDACLARRRDGTTWPVNYRDCLYQTARKQALLVWSYAWYPLLDKLSNALPFYARMSAFARGWDGIVLQRAHVRLARYAAGERLDDFFQALMEDRHGVPRNLEWGEVVAEVSIMMNAGSATTAIAMANVLHQLLKPGHAAVLRRLREEIDAALGEDDVVAPYGKVKHLPYLRAVLDESLRLWPPTSHGLPRETPAEGMVVAGHAIGGGVTVSQSALIAHRNEEIFPDADKFIPERFLGDAGKALQPYFISFSAGARGCIGRNITYLEQIVLLASVLHRYEFALERPDWEIERLETFNLLLGEMPLKVWRRQRRDE